MLTVTLTALERAHIGLSGMKSFSYSQVFCDMCVTIQAKLLLGGPIEQIVTLAAILFDICVCLRHQPRHHQTFQAGSGAGASKSKSEQNVHQEFYCPAH